MPNLGGDQLRGYRTNRFYGKQQFWQSTDIRIRLLNNENKIVPFSLGLIGSFDYGKVWLEAEESKNWHTSYGGGIWIRPLDVLIFSLASYFPKEAEEESPRIVFKVGFGF
jgi:outer membrane protein assembly factor BamA